MVGINWQYLKLQQNNSLSQVSYSLCSVCGVTSTSQTKPTETLYSPLLWDSHCKLACNPWNQADRKTSQCIQFNPYLNFIPNPSTVDNYVCGATFFDELNKNTCEGRDYSLETPLYPANNDCTNECVQDPNKKMVCRKDIFGKSECNTCSLDYCNNNREASSVARDCQKSCGYQINSITNKFEAPTGSEKVARKTESGEAYYYNEQKLTFLKCSSVDLNIVGKINEPNSVWQNCMSCATTGLFIADPLLKYCFDSDNRYSKNADKIIPYITSGFIFTVGYIIGSIALVLIAIGPILLYRANAISVFFRFWETMQIFYMMGYYVDVKYKTSLFFKQFNFVTFELFGFKGIIMINILKLMIPQTGLQLVADSFRNMNQGKQFQEYLDIFEQYYQKQKIGLFMYDASALLDVFILAGVFVLMAKITLAIYLKFKTSSSQTGNKAGNKFMDNLVKINQGLIPTFFTWFFIENYAIFLFFAFSQYFTLSSIVEKLEDPVVLTSKLLLYFVLAFALILLPAYQLGVALGIFHNEAVLNRISALGFCPKSSGLQVIYPLTIFRRILMTLYFTPSVNSLGNTLYCVLVILLEIVEFTILAFTRVYAISAVTYLQAFGSMVLAILAFFTMFDKLLTSINAIADNTNGLLVAYLTAREIFLIAFSLFTVLVFTFGIFYIVLSHRRSRSKANKPIEGKKRRGDDMADMSRYGVDGIDHKNIEVAAI